MSGVEHSTYYDRRLRQSPALIRARRPYLVKNVLLGLGIATFAIGVYAYTISAIGQDDFEDVKVPDAPQPATAQAQTQAAPPSQIAAQAQQALKK